MKAGVDYDIIKREYEYKLKVQQLCQTTIRPEKEITHPYFNLTLDGGLTVKVGYEWDGATFYPDFDCIMFGSLIHDCLLQMVTEGMIAPENRRLADKLLKRLCIGSGMPAAEAQLVYNAVRVYSKSKGYV